MKNACRYIFVSMIITFAPSAFAAEPPKEGSYDYTACWSGTGNDVTFSKTHTGSSYEMTGLSEALIRAGCLIRNHSDASG